MRRSNLLLLLFMLCILQAPAQVPQLHFENITTEKGLSSNDITCFYQDHQGFLWIGTRLGLNRYDGSVVETFYHDPDDSNSLSGNYIVDLVQDDEGIFWIATQDGGLTRYDPSQPRNRQFRQFEKKSGDSLSLPTNRLRCLFDYDSTFLLLGAEVFPVIFLNKKTFKMQLWGHGEWKDGQFQRLFSPQAHLDYARFGNWLHKIVRRNDTLFASFLRGAGVNKVINDTLTQHLILTPINASPITSPDFCLDGSKIWLANWNKGLFVQTDSLIQKQRVLPYGIVLKPGMHVDYIEAFSDINDVVTCVRVFNRDLLIAGTTSTGLYLVNKKTGASYQFTNHAGDQNSVASNAITSLYCDRNGTWWIGTRNGISKYAPSHWQFHAQPLPVIHEHNITQYSAFEDESGTLRLCTSDGIYKKKPEDKDFRLVQFYFRNLFVEPTLIFKAAANKYILGSERSYFLYHPATEKIERMPIKGEDSLDAVKNLYYYSTYQVRDMIKDSFLNQPVLWYAPLGWGLGIYLTKSQIHHELYFYDTLPDPIGNNLSRKVTLDRSDQLWVATAEGLYRWRRNDSLKNEFDAFLHRQGDSTSISNNNITDLLVDDHNHLWITTNGGGLNEYDGKVFRSYSCALDASNAMYGIYADSKNRYWIPSAAGFEVFDRNTKKFYHVGLTAASWQLELPTRMLRTRDGNFVYGAQDHVISFNPDSFMFDDSFPKVYLRDLLLFNHQYEIQPQAAHRFEYNQNYFTFSFSSLQLGSGTSVRYRYRLKGFDKTWSAITTEGKANYTNLPPGEYDFEVMASNPLNQWSTATALLHFSINPPYWQCWWFYLLCLIALSGIIYLITMVRVRNLMKIQSIRNTIANDLHDEVGSALSTISLYSQVAKMKAVEQPELGNVLNKISDTSQEMQENMNYIVWSIQPRNDSFDQMLLRMKSYVTEMLKAKNINVSFTSGAELAKVKLKQEQRKELFLIFKEAINNIVKYAHCRNVEIAFSRQSGNIALLIADDGIGFDSSVVSAGNGQHSMNERAAALNGNIRITSREGEGTSVLLRFPIS